MVAGKPEIAQITGDLKARLWRWTGIGGAWRGLGVWGLAAPPVEGLIVQVVAEAGHGAGGKKRGQCPRVGAGEWFHCCCCL